MADRDGWLLLVVPRSDAVLLAEVLRSMQGIGATPDLAREVCARTLARLEDAERRLPGAGEVRARPDQGLRRGYLALVDPRRNPALVN